MIVSHPAPSNLMGKSSVPPITNSFRKTYNGPMNTMQQNDEDQDILSCRKYFSLWMQPMCQSWESVIHQGTKVTIRKGQSLYGKGETVHGIYYLSRGILRLISYDDSGKEAILLYVTEQNLIGESAYFNMMPVYAMYTAVEDSELYFFSKDILKNRILVNNQPLIDTLLNFMSYKVGVLLHHQCEMVNSDVRGKVCRLISDIARYNGYTRHINPHITQNEMALILNIHRSTLNRIISQLRSEQVLDRFTKRHIVINDYDRLFEYAKSTFAL